jgi:hypothetical protein
MYIKFNKDGTAHGKTFKKDEVRYETRGKRFVDDGLAIEVDYEEEHKSAQRSSIGIKDAPKKDGPVAKININAGSEGAASE